jgi:hypothetical protein
MPYCALERGSPQGSFARNQGLTYEIEMFFTLGWLSNTAQQTIICGIIGEHTGDKALS